MRRSLPVILDDGTNQYTYGLGLIGMIAPGGVISYFLPDGLGSTANVTDASGTVTATYCYDVFGSTTMRPSCNSGASTDPFLFTGEQKDNESGYSYLRARYYDPATGRFVSKDPMGGGYKYAGNNPVNATDRSGLDPACDSGSCYYSYADGALKNASEQDAYTALGLPPATTPSSVLAALQAAGVGDSDTAGLVAALVGCPCYDDVPANVAAAAVALATGQLDLGVIDGPGVYTITHNSPWTIVKAVVTAQNLVVTAVATAVALVLGGSCGSGPESTVVCSGVSGAGEGITFGNAILSNGALGPSNLQHELNHTHQYGALGAAAFLAAYGLNQLGAIPAGLITGKSSGCFNAFEYAAGWDIGGYSC